MSKRLEDLIDKQREELARVVTEDLTIVVGGELVKVEVTKLLPHVWENLVDLHPARTSVPGDVQVGYNERTLPGNYPARAIRLDGEEIDQELWAGLYASLDTVNRSNLATLMWGVNVHEAVKQLKELGKALAGRQDASPAK